MGWWRDQIVSHIVVDVVDPPEVALQRSADRRLRTAVPIGRIARDAERNPAELVELAGLNVRGVERGPLPGGPRLFTEGYVGEAVRA